MISPAYISETMISYDTDNPINVNVFAYSIRYGINHAWEKT